MTRFLRPLSILVPLLPVLACSGQVLSFGTSSAPSADTLLGADGGAISPKTSIAALTDSEADALCNWLSAEYPWKSTNPEPGSSPAPGYVSGDTIACTGATPGDPSFGWVHLTPTDCVRNLRHSACQASIASLQACASYWVAGYPAFQAGNGSFSCPDLASACADFTRAAQCDQTVFQGVYGAPEQPDTLFCAGSLPVEPGATCPGGDDDGGGIDDGGAIDDAGRHAEAGQ